MFDPNYNRIQEILAQATSVEDCDSRFVLRNVLYRASEEANYLSFQFDGDDGAGFKQARLYLEGIIADLPDMLVDGGNVLQRHHATISGALTLAHDLIAIERSQTISQLDWLEEQFMGCPCCGCHCHG
ncbi:hypothetical protein MKK63_11715 [Methylobacterium sp. J-088]|uniref:hypothetical protein n=1 Tax=Methylobacterium sp. J-088 TaxID=2836664 RepID=UPI001FB8E005|nr:hypothetical protein [Methylobacterium sp. J-088]MCJ2063376.1 hypothetical protein [Methylobacterium sp. J-088]